MCWIISALGSSRRQLPLSAALRGYDILKKKKKKRAELPRLLFPSSVLQSVLPLREQVGDAMEIIILTILSSQLRCEWRLKSYQVALMSSVRKPTPRECWWKLEDVTIFSFWSQVVFLAVGIGCPIWGIFCDKYGRKIVSVTLVLFPVFFFFSCIF